MYDIRCLIRATNITKKDREMEKATQCADCLKRQNYVVQSSHENEACKVSLMCLVFVTT